jgi:tryptophanase
MFAEEDSRTGKVTYPKMELVRLAIPRRVYTQSHIDAVADGLIALHKKRRAIRGLKFTYKPPRLRHFLARYDWA